MSNIYVINVVEKNTKCYKRAALQLVFFKINSLIFSQVMYFICVYDLLSKASNEKLKISNIKEGKLTDITGNFQGCSVAMMNILSTLW